MFFFYERVRVAAVCDCVEEAYAHFALTPAFAERTKKANETKGNPTKAAMMMENAAGEKKHKAGAFLEW